jgi:predicted XRE-type DNA-binding protein
MARKYQELRDTMGPERRARVDARVQAALKEMPLNALRKARQLTQATLSEAMQISQGDVSKLEQRTDCYVSTLRSYVAAMGGELDITARFKDGETIRITQFRELDE